MVSTTLKTSTYLLDDDTGTQACEIRSCNSEKCSVGLGVFASQNYPNYGLLTTESGVGDFPCDGLLHEDEPVNNHRKSEEEIANEPIHCQQDDPEPDKEVKPIDPLLLPKQRWLEDWKDSLQTAKVPLVDVDVWFSNPFDARLQFQGLISLIVPPQPPTPVVDHVAEMTWVDVMNGTTRQGLVWENRSPPTNDPVSYVEKLLAKHREVVKGETCNLSAELNSEDVDMIEFSRYSSDTGSKQTDFVETEGAQTKSSCTNVFQWTREFGVGVPHFSGLQTERSTKTDDRRNLTENVARPKKKKKKKKKHKPATSDLTSLMSPIICRSKDGSGRSKSGPSQERTSHDTVKTTTAALCWTSENVIESKLPPSGGGQMMTSGLDLGGLCRTQDFTSVLIDPPLLSVPRGLSLGFFGHHSHSTQLLLPNINHGELYACESMMQVCQLGGVIVDARQVIARFGPVAVCFGQGFSHSTSNLQNQPLDAHWNSLTRVPPSTDCSLPTPPLRCGSCMTSSQNSSSSNGTNDEKQICAATAAPQSECLVTRSPTALLKPVPWHGRRKPSHKSRGRNLSNLIPIVSSGNPILSSEQLQRWTDVTTTWGASMHVDNQRSTSSLT